jgi:DNA-binding MarR family transcriptional regulator
MSTSDYIQPCGLRDEEGLDFRQREVLSALSEDRNATYSFQGLRRKLGLHQEMLSRTLDRLEEQDLIERTEDGYRIGFERRAPRPVIAGATSIGTRVVEASLPHETDPTLVLERLKGRWFGEFRWLGYSATSSDLTMRWISDDGRIQLRARLHRNVLTIDTVYSPGIDEERAMRSALDLFELVTSRTSLMPHAAS